MSAFKSTPLYGGAIVADLPPGFADVSNIREVPDHQEVYLDANGFSSIIFDITERVTPEQASTDEEALKFHYGDIVSGTLDVTKFWHGGNAVLTKMSGTPAYILFATQHKPEGTTSRNPTADFTGIILILVRLEAQKTDIIVSINVPHMPGEYRKEDIDLPAQKTGPLLEAAAVMKQRILETFEVKDFGLFVNEEE